MERRNFVKLLGMLPFVGPAIANMPVLGLEALPLPMNTNMPIAASGMVSGELYVRDTGPLDGSRLQWNSLGEVGHLGSPSSAVSFHLEATEPSGRELFRALYPRKKVGGE